MKKWLREFIRRLLVDILKEMSNEMIFLRGDDGDWYKVELKRLENGHVHVIV